MPKIGSHIFRLGDIAVEVRVQNTLIICDAYQSESKMIKMNCDWSDWTENDQIKTFVEPFWAYFGQSGSISIIFGPFW